MFSLRRFQEHFARHAGQVYVIHDGLYQAENGILLPAVLHGAVPVIEQRQPPKEVLSRHQIQIIRSLEFWLSTQQDVFWRRAGFVLD